MDSTNEKTKVWPPHKYAHEQLTKSGEVEYGNIISWKRIHELFRSGPRDQWPFIGEWMNFTNILKLDGFVVTERGMNDKGVRILTREEMADYVRHKETNKANDSLKNSLMLSKVPTEGLSEEHIKKLGHWSDKAALVGATAKVFLRKKNLPSPEMAIKSLRSICGESMKKEES